MSKTELNISMGGAFLAGLTLAFEEHLGFIAPVPAWLLVAAATVIVVAALMVVRRNKQDERGRQ